MSKYRHSVRREIRLSKIGEPVVIPPILIERLKQFEPCFIKVAAPIEGNPHSGKDAVEHAFQTRPYNADDPSLQAWLAAGNNYGILAAGKGLVIVETDTQAATDKVVAWLEAAKIDTLTIASGGGGPRRHFYIFCNAGENGVIDDDKGENVGHVQVKNKYAVGAGSRHHTANVYRIVNDAPIALVTQEQLNEIFGTWLTWTGQRRKREEEYAEKLGAIGKKIPMERLFDLNQFKLSNRGEYVGSHPLHGSTTGTNFNINPSKGVWHCFRHESGGAGLEWIVVKYGIIKCSESHPGCLTGAKYIEAMQKAKEEGFDVDVPDENLNPNVEHFFEDKKFVPAYLATEMMKEDFYITRIPDEKIFCYNKDRGIYEDNGHKVIRQKIQRKLGKSWSSNRSDETEKYIQTKTMRDLPALPKGMIAVKNGILDTKTRELKPFSPEYFVVNALPVTYNPQASCPKYLKFTVEVIPPQEDRDALQEFLGYILHPNCDYHKVLILIGEGQNGKSTLLNVWIAFLGEENVTSVSLQEISRNRFKAILLLGKLANICTDLNNSDIEDAGPFLKLSVGDKINVEAKYKQGFDLKNTCKLAYATNNPPKSPQDDTAWWRRLELINFPNSFPEGDKRRNPNMLEEIITDEELSGILNYALDGLDRLIKQKHFTGAKTTEQIREMYMMMADSQKAFCDQKLEATEDKHLTKEEVYDKYFQFCLANKLPKVERRKFSENMPFYVPKVVGSHTTLNGVNVQTWMNVTWKTEEGQQ